MQAYFCLNGQLLKQQEPQHALVEVLSPEQVSQGTPADEALVSSVPRLQMTEVSCRSCKPSLLLRRMGNGWSSSGCCIDVHVSETVPSRMPIPGSGPSAKSDLRLSGLLESLDRSICNHVPAFARDSTPLRTSGVFDSSEYEAALSAPDA